MLEIIFSAVADAVIGKALDVALAPLNLDERLAKRIKCDPAKLAFQKALARAYTGFVRSYPELGPQLFTEPFLANEAATELAALTVGRESDPVHFAHLWVETPRHHITTRALVDASGKPTNLAVDAAQHFLHLLRAELRHDEVFRPVFDSQAFDHLPEIADSLADLNKALQQALKEAEGYSTRIQGNVDTGGGDFIARDKIITNYYFTGNYAKLELFYDPPDYIYNRVEVDNFVGRRQLQEQIQQFIHAEGRDNGLLLIEGEAGLGKTALMAHLVREHGYFHVFGDRFNGEGRRSEAVAHLAAQIVSRFQIEGYRDGVSLEIAQSSRFLQRVLEAAAAKLSYGECIVLVYDALDQAGSPTQDYNPLGLPMALPKGVFVIASQRPVQQPPKCEGVPREPIKLEARDANNLNDIREFLRMKATHDRKITLKLGSYSAHDFVRILSERASGNWMYLYFVLAEIERGSRGNPLALDQLPSGLNAYYCDYWQRLRMDASGQINPLWQKVYAPLLGILGAVDEPVFMEQILDWTGLQVQQDLVEDLITRQWRAFVMEQRERTDDRLDRTQYQFIHRSLTRFMRGEVEEGLGVQEQRFIKVVKAQTAQGHQMIVGHFRSQCDGVWHLLMNNPYARRNLSRHMFEATPETLFAMVAMSDLWAKAREQKEESYAGYLIDLDYAWRYADQTQWRGLGDQARCALIKSSIHALASNLTPELLKLLVETRLWGPLKTLEHTFQISADHQRVEAIVAIFPLLPDRLKTEALQVAKEIKAEDARARALTGLAPHLEGAQKVEVVNLALQVAKEIKAEDARARALTELAPHLEGAQKSEAVNLALQVAKEIKAEDARARALTGLAPHLEGAQKVEVVNLALQVAKEIKAEDARARALTGLAPHLEGVQKSEVVNLALQVVKEIKAEDDRARALTGLAPHLEGAQKVEVVNLALQVVKEIKAEDDRARALTGLAPHLEGAQKVIALQVVKEIKAEYDRARALTGLAPHLEGAQKVEVVNLALQVVKEIKAEDDRAWALTGLAPHLEGAQKVEVVNLALQVVKEIKDEDDRAWALTGLAPHLEGAQKVIALQVAKEIKDENARARALTGLAPHLEGAQKVEVVNLALQVAKEIKAEDDRARALTGLTPHLEGAQKVEAVNLALQVVKEIKDEDDRARALTGLAPHLEGVQKSEAVNLALQVAKEIKDEDARARALTGLAPHLEGAQKSEVVNLALQVAKEIKAEYARAWALTELAPHLEGAQKVEVVNLALQVVKEIKAEYARAWALTELAPHLEGAQKSEAVNLALQVAKEIKAEYARARALTGLAPHLEGAQKVIALQVAKEIKAEDARARALTGLAPHLEGAQKSEVVNLALQVVKEIKAEYARAWALTGLAPHLEGAQKVEVVNLALQVVKEIKAEDDRARALTGLAPHLEGAQKVIALQVAKEIKAEDDRARALTGLAPHLEGAQKVIALQVAKEIKAEDARASALTELAPHLEGAQKSEVLLSALLLASENAPNYQISEQFTSLLTAWQSISFASFEWDSYMDGLKLLAKRPRSDCIKALSALLPLLIHYGGPSVAGEILHAIRDTAQWWP